MAVRNTSYLTFRQYVKELNDIFNSYPEGSEELDYKVIYSDTDKFYINNLNPSLKEVNKEVSFCLSNHFTNS